MNRVVARTLPPRRIERRARRLDSRTQAPSINGSFVRRLTMVGMVLIGLSTATALLFVKPRKIECRTQLSTTCPVSIEQGVQQLTSVRWWMVPSRAQDLRRELMQQHNTLTDLVATRRVNGTVLVTITQADPLFQMRWQNQDWQVYSTLTAQPTNKQPPFVVQWQDEQGISGATQHATLIWSPSHLMALNHLLHKLENWYPRITKVTVLSPDMIEIFPEGKPVVALQVQNNQEVDRQLATLQAFFSSSTIDTPHQRIDVRFEDVILQ